ncbi:32fabbc5-75eb-478b-9b29-e3d7b16befc9 [Sclerotinia trifoliorum]|uniref:32fabbc5-75eb-478b-9b29-e3d7b16befc9 n=1 Tax=Sclerotinia trifoliorum TaxID=28548 RepID=A0A8H2W1Y5_9HELO|nr:32fabbc5-75eb-478b-9b29-e3d7b16befc9 [Sclerotinia trifoliorum]
MSSRLEDTCDKKKASILANTFILGATVCLVWNLGNLLSREDLTAKFNFSHCLHFSISSGILVSYRTDHDGARLSFIIHIAQFL